MNTFGRTVSRVALLALGSFVSLNGLHLIYMAYHPGKVPVMLVDGESLEFGFVLVSGGLTAFCFGNHKTD